MLEALRNAQKSILIKSILMAIVVSFVFFGMGSLSTLGDTRSLAASVNGIDITKNELTNAIGAQRQRLSQQFGGKLPPSMLDDSFIADTALQSLIDKKIQQSAASKSGAYFSDNLVADFIKASPYFQVDGEFNADRFTQVLQQNGLSQKQFLTIVKSDNIRQQIQNGITTSAFAIESDINSATKLERQTRDFAYLQISVAEAETLIEVSDEDINSYYELNPSEFVRPEQASIEYIELKKSDLLEKAVVPESDIKDLYEERSNTPNKDVERKASHILVAISDQLNESQAKDKIDQIKTKLEAGEIFETLAQEFSDDPGSAAQGGDLGFALSGTYVEPFEKALESLSVGQISEPTLTEYGYHIIKLLEIKRPVAKTYEEMKASLEAELKGALAAGEILDLGDELETLAYETSDLVSPAEALELSVQKTDFFSRDKGEGVVKHSQVRDAAFSDDVLIEENNSSLVQISPDHYLVLRILEHRPEIVRPLAEVRDDVVNSVRTNKAKEQLVISGESALKQLRDGVATSDVADQLALNWKIVAEGGRFSPNVDAQIIRKAFEMPHPLADEHTVDSTSLANGDFVLLVLKSVKEGDANTLSSSEKKQLASILERAHGSVDFEEYRAGLYQVAKIEKY